MTELILDLVIILGACAGLGWMERQRRAEVRRDDDWDRDHGSS